jgi:hypothetical protein
MKKVALVIIYNHQFNKNIQIIENIYKERFSDIYHIVPFYNGDKKNVIPVYECSYYFSGYIAQSYTQLFNEQYNHYFFVADDLILNPVINENNYNDYLCLGDGCSFIPGFINLNETREWWERVSEAYNWSISVPGVEANNQLPDYEEALKKFVQFRLSLKSLKFYQIWRKPSSIRDLLRFKNNASYVLGMMQYVFFKRTYKLSYPLVGSYSDIFIVSGDAIKQFCHYCGVFATTKLFVELAIPTSLVFSAKEIKTEESLNLKGKALWNKQDFKELDKYNLSLRTLLDQFPSNYLYLHPVKLSKWDSTL